MADRADMMTVSIVRDDEIQCDTYINRREPVEQAILGVVCQEQREGLRWTGHYLTFSSEEWQPAKFFQDRYEKEEREGDEGHEGNEQGWQAWTDEGDEGQPWQSWAKGDEGQRWQACDEGDEGQQWQAGAKGDEGQRWQACDEGDEG